MGKAALCLLLEQKCLPQSGQGALLPFLSWICWTGTAWENSFRKKWRILHSSEQHLLDPSTVSLGEGKGWLAIAAATEGWQILVLCTAELSSTRQESKDTNAHPGAVRGMVMVQLPGMTPCPKEAHTTGWSLDKTFQSFSWPLLYPAQI